MVRKPTVLSKFNLREGKGEVEFHYILSKDEMMGHGPTYARLVLKPGSSIGWHQHIGTMEPYYILSGTGAFIDDDGTTTVVGVDDVCYIEPNQSHSIENISNKEDLVLMALVLNDRNL